MKYYNDEGSLVIKSWCNEPEETALVQARNLAKLPFAFKQICLMPDTHQGYGMPIGGVFATNNVLCPNAVGVDIGCGMDAVKTSVKDISIETLKIILGSIRDAVPVGFNHHKEKQDSNLLPKVMGENLTMYTFSPKLICSGAYPIVAQEYESSLKQLGTLGGGNHFIEIQKDEEDFVWIMVHSGSRNLGKKVAEVYNKLAILKNARWHSSVPREHDLAFLPIESDAAKSYKREMEYCVDFAAANRALMLSRIKDIFINIFSGITFTEEINIAHNYARYENHFGKNVIVHRKGATSAKKGELGIIPGSQGTSSYIVRGLGNPESFMSCSHGAGRKMGRKQAERTLNLGDEQKKLDGLGILHSVRGKGDLDEASGAYKDIDVVMAEQIDLVEIVTKLRPLAVIKG